MYIGSKRVWCTVTVDFLFWVMHGPLIVFLCWFCAIYIFVHPITCWSTVTRHIYPCFQEDLSRHNWKIVDWDVKNQIKQKPHNSLTVHDIFMQVYRNVYQVKMLYAQKGCSPFPSFQVMPLWLFFYYFCKINLGIYCGTLNTCDFVCQINSTSSIPARSHTFVEIDHEIISTVILLLPLIHSRRVVVSYKRKYVHK